ncbi:hypothetical protein [Microcystis viridis]|nr:hypothetical protein [Microcystis viridis]
MTRLTPIQIDENTLIYIESTDDLEIPAETVKTEGRVAKGGTSIPDKQQILQNF